MKTTTAHLPSLLAFARPADDLEAQASMEADLEDAHRAASLLGGRDPWLTAASLLAGAATSLDAGRQPWALLDGADRLICDLRMEHGAEDWHAADWSVPAVQDLATLDDLACELRCRTRALRTASPRCVASPDLGGHGLRSSPEGCGTGPTSPPTQETTMPTILPSTLLRALASDPDEVYQGSPARVARALTRTPHSDALAPEVRAVAVRAAELLDLHATAEAALDHALVAEARGREERKALDLRHLDEADALVKLVMLARAGQLVGGVARAVRRKAAKILAADPLPRARERAELALYGLDAPAVAA